MVCPQRELILQMLFPNRVDSTGGENAAVIVESSDSLSKEFPSTNCSGLPNKGCASVSNQITDGGIKDEINISKKVVDCFWGRLENLLDAIDMLRVDGVKMEKALIRPLYLKELVDHFIKILTSMCGSLPEIPVYLENKNEMGEVVSLLDVTKQLCSALNVSDSMFEIDIVLELSMKILARRQRVEPILNELLLRKNANVEDEPSQASTAAGNDELLQNVLEGSKDSMSKNSQGASSSGHGNNMENNKGRKNKSKKNKGRKKGKK